MIYALAIILLALTLQGAPETCDPALAALFTPVRPHLGRYEACVSPTPLRDDQGEALDALDAFGAAGIADRAKLARLYGGMRVRVTRGWARRGDDLVSTTRLSPYPDASLTRLIPGTLEIRFILPAGL